MNDSDAVKVGTLEVTCPVCETQMPVPVTCQTVDDDIAYVGGATLTCNPDMTDVWAHMWTHEEEA